MAGKRSSVPAADQRITDMAHALSDAKAALRITKSRMKEQYERGKKTAHEFNVGDFVGLSSKDIKIHQQSPKLGPRQLGPFKVLERVGELDYRIELPAGLNINPVIHVDRLSPWRDNGLTQPAPPPPDIVDGEEEYEVEEILDSRIYRKKLQYLVKWKGYGHGENTWEPAANFDHASEVVEDFHKKYPTARRRLDATLSASLQAHAPPALKQAEYPWDPDHPKSTLQSPWSAHPERDTQPPLSLLQRDSTLRVQLIGGKPPTRGSDKAAGFDLYSNEATTLASGQIAPIATGIKITPPAGTYARIAPRSGLSLKGISTTAGVVDCDYTGEVKVMLINQSKSPFTINIGDRIAQLVLERIAEADIQLVNSLDATARGAHGFGSTGK